MVSKKASTLLLLTLSLVLTACGGGGGGSSSGSTDNGSTGSGSTDNGSTDNGSTDNGSTDNGSTDNGSTDNGSTDNGSTDNGSTDNGSTDNGSTDNGSTDNGSTDNGSTDTVSILTVFDEGLVDSTWSRDINAYDSAIEWAECNNDGGAGCPSIGWEIVSDSERGNVLQVSHTAAGNAAGIFIGSEAQDLSEYSGGEIIFDIKVVSGDSNITMKIDCVWPCTSGDKQLGSVGASDWQTVTMPVDNLVAGGLELIAVDTGLVIWASNATSTVFQLDNVRWEATGEAGDGSNTGDGTTGGGNATAKAINTTNWFHQTQIPWPEEGGWFNGEQQHYTNRIENSYVSNGSLKIVAKQESFRDQGLTKQYTSARLNSKFAFTYGRVTVRAKLPRGAGTWPAIWTLGKNISENGAYWETKGFGTTRWPACGEIDIMEHWGNNQNFVQSAMHTPSSFGGTDNHGGQRINSASSKFHIYEMDWQEDKIIFSVDGIEHYTYKPPVRNSSTWPYDKEQYLLLNIAIERGGTSADFTQSAMEIDYVRVYADGAGPSDQPIWADEFE